MLPESEYGDASGAGWAVDYGTDLKFGFGGHGLFGVGVGFRGNLGKVGDEETVRRAVAGEGCFSAGAAVEAETEKQSSHAAVHLGEASFATCQRTPQEPTSTPINSVDSV